MIVRLFLGFITLYKVEASSLWCYQSENNYSETPLTTPLSLLSDPSFDINKTTVIYTFGFVGTMEGKDANAIVDAYNEYKRQNNINFLMLDWKFEAKNESLGTIQNPLIGIQNAEEASSSKGIDIMMKLIGRQLGDALIELSNRGLDLDRVHLVGHSLGAHLMGYAGKRTQENGKYINRITGLDPTGLLKTEPIKLLKGLRKSDAWFVDVLHTDPYSLGSSDILGTVDIWANCDWKLQPGCPDEFKNKCSHFRGLKYFAEAIKNPTAFPAVQARDCGDWVTINRNHNIYDKIAYLGENIDKRLRGNFYLRTNEHAPPGKGMDGIYP